MILGVVAFDNDAKVLTVGVGEYRWMPKPFDILVLESTGTGRPPLKVT